MCNLNFYVQTMKQALFNKCAFTWVFVGVEEREEVCPTLNENESHVFQLVTDQRNIL